MNEQFLHGGDIYRNPVEYDFSVNINPLGMPEGSIQAAHEGILLANRYPDYKGEALCKEIASAEGVKESQILLGNGAAEIIYALCNALRPKKCLACAPTFQEYEAAAVQAGGEMMYWKLFERENFRIQKDFLSAITESADILFLCNPNNPTGSLIEKKFLLEIAEKCEQTKTYLCIDECFLPFVEKEEALTMKRELELFSHLIVLRAFTKLYGMPGLRLGYALSANDDLLGKMKHTLQPWNTSIPAQMAGIAAIRDQEYVKRTRKLIAEEKEYLIRELSKGLVEKVYDSAANYIFFQSRTGLKEGLLQQGILIRSCGNYRNLTGKYFRIGVRTHEENEELIRRWRKITWQSQS